MSPEATKVLNLLNDMADDVTGEIDWSSTEDAAGRIGRLNTRLKYLARTLGADDVAERIEADNEREMVALFGDGYRERWTRERAERERAVNVTVNVTGATDEAQAARKVVEEVGKALGTLYAYARVSDRREQ